MIPQKRNINPHVSISDTSEIVGSKSADDVVSSHSREPTLRSLHTDLADISAADVASSATTPSASLAPTPVNVPRRTGRARKPPDRYGEWISNQVTAAADPGECQIWYV